MYGTPEYICQEKRLTVRTLAFRNKSVRGAYGMLKGRRATCYPGFEDQLHEAKLTLDPVVVDQDITTSRGPGTAMSFALSLVEQLKGKSQADSIRKGMLL